MTGDRGQVTGDRYAGDFLLGNGDTIRIGQEIQCLPYVGFFLSVGMAHLVIFSTLMYCNRESM